MSENITFFDLDPNHLDDEWLSQPKIYYEQAVRLADARAEHEKAKSAHDVAKNDRDDVAAELDLKIRKDPITYGLEKVTEPAIDKCVRLQPEFKEGTKEIYRSKDRINKAAAEVGQLEALVSALDHRKKALEKLVELWMANYFSMPKEPKNAVGRMTEVEKRTLRKGISSPY